jgi:hypothetical protein
VSEEEEAMRLLDEFLAKKKAAEAAANAPTDTFSPVPPYIRALEYVAGIYQGRWPLDSGRFRAATAALPYENPKLAAVVVAAAGGDFADRLSAARLDRKRFDQAATKTIEHVATVPAKTPAPLPAENYNAPFAPLRRF